MAKIIDNLKEQLMENVLTEIEIDAVMEKERYYPIESDIEQEEGILKYSKTIEPSPCLPLSLFRLGNLGIT